MKKFKRIITLLTIFSVFLGVLPAYATGIGEPPVEKTIIVPHKLSADGKEVQDPNLINTDYSSMILAHDG